MRLKTVPLLGLLTLGSPHLQAAGIINPEVERVERAPKEDYYAILGLNRNASETEIKARYRKLAKEIHPDFAPAGDDDAKRRYDEAFKRLNAANEILGDPAKRATWEARPAPANGAAVVRPGSGPQTAVARPYATPDPERDPPVYQKFHSASDQELAKILSARQTMDGATGIASLLSTVVSSLPRSTTAADLRRLLERVATTLNARGLKTDPPNLIKSILERQFYLAGMHEWAGEPRPDKSNFIGLALDVLATAPTRANYDTLGWMVPRFKKWSYPDAAQKATELRRRMQAQAPELRGPWDVMKNSLAGCADYVQTIAHRRRPKP